MKFINLKAPAKINIGLKVLEKRLDGFHNIQTLFYPIKGLYDSINISKSDINSFSGNFPSDVNESNNLILKAKKLIEDFCKNKFTCEIKTFKKIPIGAGLGGGSSDAATTLIGLNSLYNLELPVNILTQLALNIGSDVPFFLNSKPAIGTSRGELLEEIKINIPYYILLINPNIHISTKSAFENITPNNQLINYYNLDFTNETNLNIYQKEILNDFEITIFNLYPEIKNICKIMFNAGALFSKMTGTGSTVFGFFNKQSQIQEVLQKLPKQYFHHIEIPHEDL